MKVWVSRQYNGQYMLTASPPIWAPVDGTYHWDFYAAPGDPIGVRHLCDVMRKGLGLPFLARGGMMAIELTARLA
jgi:hypothetical protein